MTKTILTKPSVGKWMKATFLGWVLGIALILILSSALEALGIHEMQFYLGVGIGAGVGFIQWLYLRKIIPITSLWIAASVLGMGVPFIIFDFMPAALISHKLAWSVVCGSFFTGLLQYGILKKWFEKTWTWIPGSFAGWILGVATAFSIDYTKQLKSYIPSNLAMAAINLGLIFLGGVVLGSITGIVMTKTLKRMAQLY